MTVQLPPDSAGSFARLLGVSVACAALLTAACTAHGPPREMEPDELFRWSVETFESGDYGSAAQGLRDFLLEEPLHPKVDSAQFLLGQARYQDEKYVEATEAFDRLAVNRPGSPLADDAQFGVCRSYWALSPELALDQTYTRDARDACERLLQYYTPSPLEEKARALRDSATHKLAAKQLRIARWYFDHGAYQSANIYLEDILEEYSDAPVAPEVMGMLFRSYRELGFDREARAIRERLLEEHGDTKAAREVRELELPTSPS